MLRNRHVDEALTLGRLKKHESCQLLTAYNEVLDHKLKMAALIKTGNQSRCLAIYLTRANFPHRFFFCLSFWFFTLKKHDKVYFICEHLLWSQKCQFYFRNINNIYIKY